MELIRRYIRPPKSSGGNSIFPLHLTLEQVDSDDIKTLYRLDPTPETIALADYVLQNKQFDNSQCGFDIYYTSIPPSSLYINGVEVKEFYIEFYGGEFHTCQWNYKDEIRLFDMTEFLLVDFTYDKKGTMNATILN